MKSYLVAAITFMVSLVTVSECVLSGQENKASEKDKASIWMKKKLELSQNILAGLTESDFEKVRLNAEGMKFLGYLEKWDRGDMPDYKRQLSYFEIANRELIRQAREKNLDGATLAYNQLTVSCVQCHKIVRGAKK